MYTCSPENRMGPRRSANKRLTSSGKRANALMIIKNHRTCLFRPCFQAFAFYVRIRIVWIEAVWVRILDIFFQAGEGLAFRWRIKTIKNSLLFEQVYRYIINTVIFCDSIICDWFVTIKMYMHMSHPHSVVNHTFLELRSYRGKCF